MYLQNLRFHEQSEIQELEVAIQCPLNVNVYVQAAVKSKLLTLRLTVGKFVMKTYPLFLNKQKTQQTDVPRGECVVKNTVKRER